MDLDKLNIREMLDKFKQTKDGFDRTFRDIFSSDDPEEDDVQDTPDTASDTVSDFEDESVAASAAPEEEEQSDEHEPENTDDNTAIPRAEQPDLKAVEDKLNSLNEQLDKIDEAISMLKTDSANASNEAARIIRIAENISGKVNRTADRLTELNNSLAGVSKLNDSIFDLKNSQMNTKNSLGELQSAFFKLKKKMTAGVTIITVLAAVIAVLEVINLLS